MKQRLAQHLRPRSTLGQNKSNQMFCVKVAQLCPTLCDPMDYTYSPWNSPGQNTAVDSHFLFQRSVGYHCRKFLPGQRVYKQCLGGCYSYKKSVFSEEILQEKLYNNFLGRWIYEFSLSVYVSEQWCITAGSIRQCSSQMPSPARSQMRK